MKGGFILLVAVALLYFAITGKARKVLQAAMS